MEQQRNGCIEDEVSLVDLFVVLLKWKWVVIASVFIALIVAVAMIPAQDKEKRYTYSTVIELGSVLVPGGVRPLDEPENLVAKLETTYIPNAKTNINTNLSAQIDNPRNSYIAILNTTGTVDQKKEVEIFHSAIAELVIADMRAVESEVSETLLKKTTVIAPTAKSAIPAKGKSLTLILTLGLVLGLIVGVLGSFLLEFIVNMRAELKGRAHSG